MTRPPIALLAAAAVAVTLALAACGDDDAAPIAMPSATTATTPAENRAAVLDVMETYTKLLVTGNYGQACKLMTEDARNVMMHKALQTRVANVTCGSSVAKVMGDLTPKQRTALERQTYEVVSLSGDQATVRGSSADGTTTALAKQGGDWLITVTG